MAGILLGLIERVRTLVSSHTPVGEPDKTQIIIQHTMKTARCYEGEHEKISFRLGEGQGRPL